MNYKLMIKKIRLEKGISQSALARKANVRQSYISALETNPNAKSPTLRVITKIAEALNVCPYILVQYNMDCDKNCLKNCKQNFF